MYPSNETYEKLGQEAYAARGVHNRFALNGCSVSVGCWL